ncbi:glycoside hydrolase family 95 protein [Cohnella massiliensis]|uniref:glycoside hydrolase family 95 protein n=1 Tax=Cohnella massiliensis TaxID=1816691 RepID=UPI00111BB3EE|nr:glycoside hydrolase family 95 protein [Cohnella massiliensis]
MGGNNLILWYRRPASEWVEALPVGNGSLGGMVFGGAKRERIQLNEDTLWSGHPYDPNDREAAEHLGEVRRLVSAGSYPEAQRLVEEHMLGPWTASYQAMGDLGLSLDAEGEAAGYRRELDLNDAVCRTGFALDGVRHTRETFASAPDQVIVVRLAADSPGKVSVTARLSSLLRYRTEAGENGVFVLRGQAPSHVEPFHAASDEPIRYEENKGNRFEIWLRAVSEGGSVHVDDDGIRVTGADAVTFLLAAATSFNGFDKDPYAEGKDPAILCLTRLARATAFTYEELLARHRADYRALFGRVAFELAAPGLAELPTDERLEAARAGRSDEPLAALFFQFGRYLLIASSRPGTQPATLQGIWNDRLRPPWACNYTVNINTQMNYWPAETTNLAECHAPLFDLLEELRTTGRETARIHYRAGGWVCHHATDLWRIATPSGGPSKGPASWAFWPMGGAWLCGHLWEHYRFGGDESFLRERAYPIMREAALFFLDWLVEDGEGYLTTNPSTSPENTFRMPDGRKAAVSLASTMDNSLLRELFANCIEASSVLGIDAELRGKLEAARSRLRPLAVGRHGQLREWFEDFEEAEPGHRHMAHLYGLHPGAEIDRHRHPKLAEACQVSIERRLLHEKEDAIGWCFAWLISLFARLEEPDRAHHYLVKLLRNPFPNLFNAHRHPKLTFYPLTVEANFGATAGIAELLLQSHAGELRLLPALPKQWPEGRIRGLRARGGFAVGLEWSGGALLRAEIESFGGRPCRIRSVAPLRVRSASGGEVDVTSPPEEPNVCEFATEAGRVYTIVPAQPR